MGGFDIHIDELRRAFENAEM